MDWTDTMKDTRADLAKLRPEIPEVAAAFNTLANAATAEGALDTKTKELIAIAIGVAKQCNDCIGFHTRAAIRAGATREELAEVIGMCVYMGGGPSLMYGAKAMAAFDAFSD
ncbi:carboxymuconolactone decarboxylase family protein [Oceanomicrobium pacificus]|uniref:Carboxymuconolactone decarboxylase family protein n=1 Tax=Oceanomicrobium pacificus TaxID=2692916 RepID=A0A6B0TRR9_9RHOB|nr:carboxymuconolactone decarboxylase family protein [Oceanomicrobium pacificus]MXU64054.1 carboxymuconolactone decarboxylase family protein [Oceanomicrobium pacificus]